MTAASVSLPTTRPRPRTRIRRLPVIFAVATVGLEIAYPLAEGRPRNVLTVATVVTFFLASASHSLIWRGRRETAVLVAVTAGGGFAVEALGTRTGLPFGHYTYAGTLGPRLASVPLVIPLAWTMMAYPALVVARRLSSGRNRQALVAGWGLASWDLFLDPQMVAAGHWRWSRVGVALPGVPGVPAGNYLGWLLAAVVMMAVLVALLPARPPPPSPPPPPPTPTGATTARATQHRTLSARDLPTPAGSATRPRLPDVCRSRRGQRRTETDDRVPYALYLWTWASSALANLAFFGRPAVAAWGGVAMGLVAVPLIESLRRR